MQIAAFSANYNVVSSQIPRSYHPKTQYFGRPERQLSSFSKSYYQNFVLPLPYDTIIAMGYVTFKRFGLSGLARFMSHI